MNEVERVREQIARQICSQQGWEWGRKYLTNLCYDRADEILSLEGIAVLDDDQSLPSTSPYRWMVAYILGQQDMLKTRFKKVVKHE
jgi:hypothetical protein